MKLTDLTSVFELFIFSDILELNREILKEGSSLILTLIKTFSNDENKLKRINVQKIGSLKEILNKPIKEVTFDIKSLRELDDLSKSMNKNGETLVNINFHDDDSDFNFQLEKKRHLNRKTLNLLRNKEILSTIS